jgi:hypothetical protein
MVTTPINGGVSQSSQVFSNFYANDFLFSTIPRDIGFGKLTNTFGCPASLVEAFRVASNRKETETCWKQWITSRNSKKGSNGK